MNFISSFAAKVFFVLLPAMMFLPTISNAQIDTDTLNARQKLIEAAVLLDSSFVDDAFLLVQQAVELNRHQSNQIDEDAAALASDAGKAFFRQSAWGKVDTTFGFALATYRHTSAARSEQTATLHNNLGITMRSQWRLEEALHHFREALTIRKEIYSEPVVNVAKTHNNIGVILSDLGRNSEALESYKMALSVKRQLPDIDALDLASTYSNIGGLYSEMKNTVAAEDNFERAFSILGDRRDEKALLLSSRLYNNIAAIFTYRKDYYKAIQYHEKSIALREGIYGTKHLETVRGYDNLAGVYMEMGKTDAAEELALKSYGIVAELEGDSSFYSAISNFTLGSVYAKAKAAEKAERYLKKAVTILRLHVPENHYYTVEFYNNLAGVYKLKEEADSALVYYRKALAINQFLAEDKLSTGELQARFNLGLTEFDKGNVSAALRYFNEIIKKIEQQENISPEYQFIYFETLLNKAELLAGSAEAPAITQQVFEKALQMGEEFRDLLEETYSKATFLELIKRASEGLIRTCLKQQNEAPELRRLAFSVSEKSIGFLLREGIRETQTHSYAGVADSLLLTEVELRQKIAENEVQLYAEKTKEPQDKTTVDYYNDRLIQLNRDYADFKTHLQQEHPAYYRQRYDFRVEAVQDVQNYLRTTPNRSLVEYFLGDSSLFIFLVQADRFEVKEVALPDDFYELIRGMTQQGIYGYYNVDESLQSRGVYARSLNNYARAASRLYQLLLSPIADQLTENLLIVPDGALGDIPFEALLSRTPDDPGDLTTYRYLIYDHQISYAYSATLLKSMLTKEHRNPSERTVLGMAPFFLGDADQISLLPDSTRREQPFTRKDSLGVLLHSGSEIKKITQRYVGDAYYGSQASKMLFTRLAPYYRIIHLSTHANANDENGAFAYIALGNEGATNSYTKLYARDLYAITLNADMVVLSACETSRGELQRGEGIFSLARAFAYAGAKSIMTTLWKVEEQATEQLVVAFYEYLETGMRKDDALHRAKLDYLGAHDKELSHPFFWASMIGVGDMRPLK